jgi:hypothetical protein
LSPAVALFKALPATFEVVLLRAARAGDGSADANDENGAASGDGSAGVVSAAAAAANVADAASITPRPRHPRKANAGIASDTPKGQPRDASAEGKTLEGGEGGAAETGGASGEFGACPVCGRIVAAVGSAAGEAAMSRHVERYGRFLRNKDKIRRETENRKKNKQRRCETHA